MPFPVVLGQPAVTLCPVSAQDGAGQFSQHHSLLPYGNSASCWSQCGPITCGWRWLLPPLMKRLGSDSHELEQTQ